MPFDGTNWRPCRTLHQALRRALAGRRPGNLLEQCAGKIVDIASTAKYGLPGACVPWQASRSPEVTTMAAKPYDIPESPDRFANRGIEYTDLAPPPPRPRGTPLSEDEAEYAVVLDDSSPDP